MALDVVLGLQYGDEGKGKIVDLLGIGYNFIARYQGGNNAGHTVWVKGKKYVLKLVPSGILRGTKCVLGTGMVINPKAFNEELSTLRDQGVSVTDKVYVSDRAHMITPWHIELERARSTNIGTTGRGIGPAYADKADRYGLHVGSIRHNSFEDQVMRSLHEANRELSGREAGTVLPAEAQIFMAQARAMEPYIRDTGAILRLAMKRGFPLLAESAQGTMLDVDHGGYPFVTSSNTTAAGAFTSLGVPVCHHGSVIGVVKAYTTRVGGGPFITAMDEVTAKKVVDVGSEFGAVTGRQRRPGWFDAFQVKYACDINGVDALALTKADVLAGLCDKVLLCTGYRYRGELLKLYPEDQHVLEEATPEYVECKGWPLFDDTSHYFKLPKTFQDYVREIENRLEVPVKLISTGPGREQTIIRGDVKVSKLAWMDAILAD